MGRKLTTEEFIEKANKIHNDKYDYSLVEYENSHKNIKIICKKHGIFEQRPNDHLNNHGCPNCIKKQLISIEEFIKKANKIHNDKYDYSLVVFKNLSAKIKIICPIHDIFEQKLNDHLNGHGCCKCVGTNKLTTKEFIEKANKVHKNKYNYSLVEYKNSSTKVKIICPTHGEFEQLAGDHLHGCKCIKCANVKQLTKVEFIEKANEIHKNKYDYSLVEYKNYTTKIKILCKKHGIFKQRPADHLSGHGCSKCKSSNGEKTIRNILKENNIQFEEQKRFKDCRYKLPLAFDFYLPNLNCCIEYDGQQHFNPYSFGSNKSKEYMLNNFEILKLKDKIKDEYCFKNNIHLIRIPYTEFKNIENIIKKGLEI